MSFQKYIIGHAPLLAPPPPQIKLGPSLKPAFLRCDLSLLTLDDKVCISNNIENKPKSDFIMTPQTCDVFRQQISSLTVTTKCVVISKCFNFFNSITKLVGRSFSYKDQEKAVNEWNRLMLGPFM